MKLLFRSRYLAGTRATGYSVASGRAGGSCYLPGYSVKGTSAEGTDFRWKKKEKKKNSEELCLTKEPGRGASGAGAACDSKLL